MNRRIGPWIGGLAVAMAVVTFVASVVLASVGSNQGNYGTNFYPAILTGQVTKSGSPVSGASVSTVAGHSTTTDGSGNYTLYMDAPGYYTVTAESGADSTTADAELVLGAISALNLVLAAVCPGDANGDDVINVLDMTKVARIILQMDDETLGADANQDGVVNVLDMTKIARIILQLDPHPCP